MTSSLHSRSFSQPVHISERLISKNNVEDICSPTFFESVPKRALGKQFNILHSDGKHQRSISSQGEADGIVRDEWQSLCNQIICAYECLKIPTDISVDSCTDLAR